MHSFQLERLVRDALAEDLASAGDITTDAIVPDDAIATGTIVARKPGVVFGHECAALTFQLLDSSATYEIVSPNGARVRGDDPVARIECSARALLTGERTALNFMCHLSGIASATRALVDAVAGTGARIVDTRKTAPGLRALEKAAVVAGGGANHRFGLYDAVLIKDNHIALAGGITAAVERVLETRHHMAKIEVEVDTLDQLREALTLPVDIVLLDNMPAEMLREAVTMVAGKVLTEASGNVSAGNVHAIAETGVDMISSGWLTHSAPALDLALDITL